jgi:tetratricopeptide (TPR) repeat protein
MLPAALAMLGRMEFDKPDRSGAFRFFEEGLAISSRHGLIPQQVRLLRYMSMHFVNFRQLDEADRVLDEAIKLSRTHGVESELGVLHNMKSMVAVERGDFPRAREAVAEALYLFRSHPNERGAAVAYQNMGEIELKDGRPDRARVYLEEALRIARRGGIRPLAVEVLKLLGWAAVAENDLPAARGHFSEQLQLALQIDSVRFGLDALAGLGVIRLRMGEAGEAVSHFGFVSGAPGVGDDTLDSLRPFLEEACALLPEGTEPPPTEPGQDWRKLAHLELAEFG